MLKRIALLGAIAALTMIWNPSSSFAQEWAGYGGWGGGWGGGCCGGGVTVTVSTAPAFPVFRRPCCRRFIPPRPVVCCRPFIPPRPVFCCNRPFFGSRFGRPPYFYGDGFEPYGYNWNAGYSEAAYEGYEGW